MGTELEFHKSVSVTYSVVCGDITLEATEEQFNSDAPEYSAKLFFQGILEDPLRLGLNGQSVILFSAMKKQADKHV